MVRLTMSCTCKIGSGITCFFCKSTANTNKRLKQLEATQDVSMQVRRETIMATLLAGLMVSDPCDPHDTVIAVARKWADAIMEAAK